MPRAHARLIERVENSPISQSYRNGSEYRIRPISDRHSTFEAGRSFSGRPGAIESAAIEDEQRALEEEIRNSLYILKIENELDDPAFVPYKMETLDRAVSFLRRLAIHAHSCGFYGFGVPEIAPASNGSIDLLWNSRHRRLLINFPADMNWPANYFGKKGDDEIAGRFRSDAKRPELIYWLAE